MSPLVPGGFADDAERYRLDSRIATGGMGEVWRAHDTVLDRPVAVKVLKPEYADDALFRTRFETEARHAGSLHHSGIAAVFDFGQASPVDGSSTPRPFLVMELVEGQPLSALLRPGSPLDPPVARDLLAQAADALGAAHRRGIVHRDVKPANLIVTPDRRVKVTDFGIARAAEGMSLTETGQVIGTPAYLSPEQAQGQPSTAASDVYALGVVAHECLSGAKPFAADSPVATALAHLREPVPTLPDSVPADLAAVVRRALAKDAAERYPDGEAFARALREGDAGAAAGAAGAGAAAAAAGATQVLPATQGLPAAAAAVPPAGASAAPPPPPERRRTSGPGVPWPLVAGIVAVAAAVLLIAWIADSLGGGEDPGPTSPTTQSPTQTQSPSDTPTETQAPSPTEEPSPETVSVDPADYVGRETKDVEKELKKLGLQPRSEQVDNDGSQAEDTVAAVEPDGEVEVGSEITVFSYGPAPDEDGDEDEGPGNSGGKGNGNNKEGGD